MWCGLGYGIDRWWYKRLGCDQWLANGSVSLYILDFILVCEQIFQMYNSKLQYFGWENLIEWVTYISALLLVIDFDACDGRTGIRQVRS